MVARSRAPGTTGRHEGRDTALNLYIHYVINYTLGLANYNHLSAPYKIPYTTATDTDDDQNIQT